MNLKSIFRKKLRTHLLEQKYKVVEAFKIGGKVYFMFDNQFEVPTGRQMAALAVYNEMQMNCDKEYLQMHAKAMKKVLSDPKKINLSVILQLNMHLEERLELMTMPDFVYKLASVVFFDESESPYNYDYEYCEKKIKYWKESGGTLDFFLKTPLKDLIPSLNMQGKDSKTYFQVASQIDQIHRRHLTDILSEGELKTA